VTLLLPCPVCEASVVARTVGSSTVPFIACSNPNCDYVYSAEELHNEVVRLRHALKMKEAGADECTLAETQLKPEAQKETGPDNQERPKQP
jgi:ssDNA-binding Zn-finger/Zn-ribbon topoisomerase 1